MTEGKKRRFPGAGWLGARLSRKMIVILLALAVTGWLLSFFWFLRDMRDYAGNIYDGVMRQSEEQARELASFLEGSRGDVSGLTRYLEERELGCILQDDQGRTVFQFMPESWLSPRLTASCGIPVTTGSGTLRAYVWSTAIDRDDLSDALGHQAFVGLSLFNLVLFLAAGVLLYLIILSPIIALRRTMLAYARRGDLPERSTRTDEVGKLQNAFADLTGELRAKEQSERRLIASISHDLKTPLTSVLGFSERLLSAQLPPEKQRQYLQSIHEKALRLKSIVDEFDEYIDVGLRDDRPMERLTAEELCADVRQEYEAELQEANVRLSVECACPGAAFLGNRDDLRRYFGNLIGNSIRHGGVRALELTLSCRRERDELVLEFRDNGTGVEPELLAQIFEPLYTSDRGRKVSGLGLSICRSIIRAHGGSVTAENAPGGGLLVRAVLPAAD